MSSSSNHDSGRGTLRRGLHSLESVIEWALVANGQPRPATFMTACDMCHCTGQPPPSAHMPHQPHLPLEAF